MNVAYSPYLVDFSSGGFVWQNSEAESYWNRLTTANGGVEVDGSIYGVSTYDLKTYIDVFFTNIKLVGLSKFTAMYLMIGATSATHALNAVSTNFSLTFVGSPSHTYQGFVCNGTSQYANCGNNPSTDGYSTSNYHSSVLVKNLTGAATKKTLIGSYGGTTQKNDLYRAITSGYYTSELFNNSTTSIASTVNGLDSIAINTKDGATTHKLYRGDTEIASGSVNAGTLTARSHFIMALDQNLTPVNYSDGKCMFASIGYGLSLANVQDMVFAVEQLQTNLGR